MTTAPMRDPLYAARALDVVRRDDGAMLLTNPRDYDRTFDTAVAPLTHWARLAPDRVFLAERSGEGWRTLSYSEAAGQVAALAGGLSGLGVKGPLLILARNGINHALMALAAMSQGFAVAAVSYQYGIPGADFSRLAHALERIGPDAVFVDDGALFSEALAQPALAGLTTIADRAPGPGAARFADLLRASPAAAVARPQDLAKLLLTSGSTGRPKAVMMTHGAIAANAAQITACFEDPEPPVLVNQAPWSHSLGANAILQQVLLRGGGLYIDAGTPTPKGLGETVRNLSEIAPTYHNMVPAGWDLLAGELERDEALARRFFSRVRLLQYGGAAMGQATMDRIEGAAVRACGETISFGSGYGSTETGPTATNVHWPNLKAGLMGLPVPQTTVKLVPNQGRLEFRVKGPQISAGYYGTPDATAEAFDEEGYYRLGDAARFVEEATPARGLVFDGRLSENFKLSSGTFVNAGALRVAVLSAIGGAALDAIVCGEGRSGVGLLLFLNPPYVAGLAGGEAEARERIREGVTRHNAAAGGGSERIARIALLPDAPHAPSGEVTDKGYINQTLARARRAEAIAALFAETPAEDVLIF
jgi:feruloyl-CoA synthase